MQWIASDQIQILLPISIPDFENNMWPPERVDEEETQGWSRTGDRDLDMWAVGKARLADLHHVYPGILHFRMHICW